MKLICIPTHTMGNCYINVAYIRKFTQDITGKRTLICTGDNDYVTVDCDIDTFVEKFIERLDEDNSCNDLESECPHGGSYSDCQECILRREG